MSNVTNISNDYIIQPTNTKPVNDPSTLNSQDFMDLMITQLQNQNPMEPMDNNDYIAQMAEFSALEEMQSMNNSINTMYAFGLMGKEVTINNADGTTVTGIVDSVSMKNGVNYLEVDGVQYNSLLVISAGEPSEEVSS
ncbi:flagellar hook capping protein [Acidaminobacter sp. JC074]|uniref:flagellar hook capping FlgD N-terminal domain-containing protein n=1 Tax=Acidaminobacter sp. JC074 TaxID=2530199 RepID=UPI001F0E6E29|nr:flagellar hook capping FlgD N-terminal domain-containing protein [Acidaminobacter sp. JC074]MCH4887432.1 flagellar hook capping protein [Acidaminobacter sp. JC074]